MNADQPAVFKTRINKYVNMYIYLILVYIRYCTLLYIAFKRYYTSTVLVQYPLVWNQLAISRLSYWYTLVVYLLLFLLLIYLVYDQGLLNQNFLLYYRIEIWLSSPCYDPMFDIVCSERLHVIIAQGRRLFNLYYVEQRAIY